MVKRTSSKWDYRYENVCLVLDDIEKLCSSDGDEGQSLAVPNSRQMIWSAPTQDVTKIELVFKKSSTVRSGYRQVATVADVKIHYSNI